MSITNLQVIEDALREINVISEVDNASPEQGKYALRKLNQLMEVWKENDIDLGYFKQTTTTGTCPIPDWAELGVTMALGIMCAPKYGATVSRETAAVADTAMGMIGRKSISEKLDNADMSHMPVGSGWIGDGYNIETDA